MRTVKTIGEEIETMKTIGAIRTMKTIGGIKTINTVGTNNWLLRNTGLRLKQDGSAQQHL